MINQLGLFRNRLGLTERDGDPVRYKAEFSMGEYTFSNVSIIEFIASLQNPIDTAHLIQLLDGVRVNLRQFFNLLKMKKLFIGK